MELPEKKMRRATKIRRKKKRNSMQCIIHTRRRRNKKLQSTATKREGEKKERKAKIFEGNAIVHAFNTRGERRMYIQREKKRGQQVDGVSGLSWLTPRE